MIHNMVLILELQLCISHKHKYCYLFEINTLYSRKQNEVSETIVNNELILWSSNKAKPIVVPKIYITNLLIELTHYGSVFWEASYWLCFTQVKKLHYVKYVKSPIFFEKVSLKIMLFFNLPSNWPLLWVMGQNLTKLAQGVYTCYNKNRKTQ